MKAISTLQAVIHFALQCVLLFVSNLATVQAGDYGFSKIPLTHNFNTNDYEGGIQNWDINENRQGFIYVANNFGLLEYDGARWKRYAIENNTRLRSLYIDTDNRIYVGGQNQLGYFEPNDKGILTFTSLRDQLPKDLTYLEDIWSITRHQDQILFCSYQGIISLENNKLSYLPNSAEYDLAFKVSHDLYSYSPTKGLSIWSGADFQPISSSEFLKSEPITGILPHKNGSLLIFQRSGQIYEYHQGIFKNWAISDPEVFITSQINKVTLLHNNNIAIGTQNNGVIIVSPDGQILQHLTKGKGLNNRTVLSLYEDQFNNLWVGLNNGITMVELGSPFSLIDEQSGLPGTGYTATFHDNRIYLGTSNGLFYQQANPNPMSNESSSYRLIRNSSGQVYNIQVINDQLLLSHHNGAYWVYDNTAHRFFQNGTWKFIKRVNDPRTIAGTYEGFELFDIRSKDEIISSPMGKFKESSRVFEFKNDSTLFMTHGYKGVYKIMLDPKTDSIRDVQFYDASAGFPSNILINVFNIGGDLVFAAERGLFTYDIATDKFVHHEKLEKYMGTNLHVTELTSDARGNIFFLTDESIGFLQSTPHGEFEKHTSSFTRIRKYLSDDLENISVIDHQNVFIGAKEGFIHFNPSIQVAPNRPFRTYIREVSAYIDRDEMIFGGAGDSTREATSLPAYFSSLKLQFAAPYFDGQSELVYQYQLENFDKDWSDWTSFSEKEYTNLSEGSYVFRVRAKNIYGEISEEAVFSLQVYPPWYRSKTAYAVYSVLVIAIFGLSMMILDSKHRKEREQLTYTQQQELQQKEHQIVEVSKKSEEEINQLRNDKLRAEIDHKNRELATTTMHLITKNEFMLTIRDAVKEISKGNSRDAIKKIIRDIDRNLSEDEGWKQFTKHFDQVHGDFLTRIKKDHQALTPQEIKLCAYLRMNMTSKEIANMLNISVRGVEISRYRLRKKLNISRDTNLVDYMMEYS